MRNPMRHVLFVLFVAALVAFGCRDGDPVATIESPPARFTIRQGGTVAVELRWAIEQQGPDEPRVFVHLLDRDERIVRTADHPFPEAWRPGSTVVDRFRLYDSVLGGEPIPEGEYQLQVGLYELGGQRWTVRHGEVEASQVIVGSLTVEPPDRLPTFSFEGWSVPQETGGRQAPVVRTAAASATVGVSSVRTGRVVLVVAVPERGRTVRQLLFDMERVPVIRVRACGGFSAELPGVGRHVLSILVPGGAGSCDVELEPSFVQIDVETLGRAAMMLEQLSWSEDTGSQSPAPTASETEKATGRPPTGSSGVQTSASS